MAMKPAKTSQRKRAQNSAAGVNAAGDQDPTRNVLALNEAGVDRQDDLREAFEKYVNVRLDCLKEIGNIREGHAQSLAVAEAKRLDAVRLFDVAGVKTEAERADAAIKTLAVQTATDRETLRNAVTEAAQTIAKQNASTVDQLSSRISALEKSSYEGKGKETVTDPAMALMVDKLDKLGNAMTTSSGKGEGREQLWKYIVAALGSGGLIVAAQALLK